MMQACCSASLWMQVTLSNLDLVIQESRSQFEQLLPHILEVLEGQWCHRFPRATAASSLGIPPFQKMMQGDKGHLHLAWAHEGYAYQ